MKKSCALKHREAENEGRSTEIPLLGMQPSIFLGNWEWNLKTKEYCWCEEMYRIFNLTSPPISLRTGTFFNGVHPEDRARVVKAWGQALVGAEPYNLEHRILWPDGSVRFVHGKAEVAFDGAGRPRRIWGTIQDITERRQSEEAL
jgi:hypothetical protein